MQLTWTNVVFSRIALVSRFRAKIQLSGKFPKNIAKSMFHPKTHGARRRDRVGPRGAHTCPRRGPGLAAPRGGLVASATPSASPPDYIKPPDLKTEGVRRFFRKSSAALPPPETPIRGPEAPFWHPAGTGNWKRSSPSPTPLHQPSMFPPSMCE